MKMKKWKCLKSELVYDSKYFRVKKDLVEINTGEQKEWTYWDSMDSAMVLGMTPDKKLVMIQQYRYMVGDVVIEFPSGHGQGLETIEKSALREFQEETGYSCSSLLKLGAYYETYGQLNRKIHFFFARDVIMSDKKIDTGDDVREDIEVVLIDFDDAITMALNNKIVAMGSALAILLLKEKLEGKRI